MTDLEALDALDRLRAAVRVGFPWRTSELYGEITSADGRYPCQTSDEGRPDPEHEYVVALVNAHPWMVADLRELRARLSEAERALASMPLGAARRALAAWDDAWAAIEKYERSHFTGRDPQLRASVTLAGHRGVDALRDLLAAIDAAESALRPEPE